MMNQDLALISKFGCEIALCILFLLPGEMFSQVIHGYVFENATNKPIAQADVYIIGDQGTAQLQTDEFGRFEFKPGYTGRFDLIISHLSYELVHLQGLQLSSHKDLNLEFPMTARIRELAVVNILAPTVRRVQNRFYTTSEEETRRLPGTFFDPARTAVLFPGVYVANDQANSLVIHGLNPSLMQWYVEGVPVLNPNHLANAGTLSDRATATGGGVNMLSNQVLSTTTLITGALPPRYGDAVSGIMDMTFRPGNVEKHETTIQAGLLGLELATEGRVLPGKNISYLANYRYSTVGLLTSLGVDFGDEKINYQDFNFNINIPLSVPGSYVKIFGVLGSDKDNLDGPKDPSERVDSRDISSVRYKSDALISGASFQWPTRKGVIKAAMAVSVNNSDRSESRVAGADTLYKYSNEHPNEWEVSGRLEFQSPRSNRITLNSGIGLSAHGVKNHGYYPQTGTLIVGGNAFLVRPYAQLSYVVTGDVVVRGGLGVSVLSGKRNDIQERTTTIVPEPTLQLYWQAGEKFSVETGYSYSGITTPQVTYQFGSDLKPDLLRTHTMSFILRNQIRTSTQIACILNYFALTHVPAFADSYSNYTILGSTGYPKQGPYTNTGKGKAISAGLALRQEIHNGTFARAGIGWVHSTHQGASGLLLSTPYDSGPWAFAAGGKEWVSDRSYGQRIFGLNGVIHWRSGMRDQRIDLQSSRSSGYTVYDAEGDFSIKMSDYFRIDLRCYLRKEKSNKTTTWSLDIQNLLSRENAYFSLYDPYQDGIRQLKQLGIVPVVSYRVDY